MAGSQSHSKVNYHHVFRRASTTHFFGSLFFAADQRAAVTKLYVFCRTADDLADEQMPLLGFESLTAMYDEWRAARAGKPVTHQLISDFVALQTQYGIPDELPEALFSALQRDATPKPFADISELEQYMYGVAGAVGIMLCYILGLPEDAHLAAKNLGYAAQLINILRDIERDMQIGRVYIPQADMRAYQLDSLDQASVSARMPALRSMLKLELDRFDSYLAIAATGYKYLSRRQQVAIWTIVDLYRWTARKIETDPLQIYRHQVKPGKLYALLVGLKNIIKVLSFEKTA